MAVQPIIPPEWGWAYDLAVGQSWPQADEDALRRLAQAWTDAMEQLLAVADGGNAAAANVNYSVQAVSSDQFNNYWSSYVDGDDSIVGQLARQSESLAAELLAFAEQTEFTKLSIDIQLVLLFIQLAIDLALAFATFGASTAEGFFATLITRLTVRSFLNELIRAVLMAVLPDVITQLVMLSEGHRSSFDVGETLQAAQMGVIGGLVGAGIFKFGGNLLGRLGEDFAGSLARAAIHGALTNVGTNMVAGTVDSAENQIHAALDPKYAKLVQEQLQDQGYADQKSGQNPLIAALNGAFTGALFHTASEASFDLAGETFGASDMMLTVDGQPRKFTALPVGDGTGGHYALFDQSHAYVGRGTVDDTGTMTVTPNRGTPYTGTVVTPHDNATTTELTAEPPSSSEPPSSEPPPDQPAAVSPRPAPAPAPVPVAVAVAPTTSGGDTEVQPGPRTAAVPQALAAAGTDPAPAPPAAAAAAAAPAAPAPPAAAPAAPAGEPLSRTTLAGPEPGGGTGSQAGATDLSGVHAGSPPAEVIITGADLGDAGQVPARTQAGEHRETVPGATGVPVAEPEATATQANRTQTASRDLAGRRNAVADALTGELPREAGPASAGQYRVVTEQELAGARPTREELGRYVGRMHAAAMDGGDELAIAVKAGAGGQPGRLIVVAGTRDGVGLPPGYEDYRIIWHTQQGEGPSAADVAAATSAGHPYEIVTEHWTDPDSGGTFTRTRLFDQQGNEIRYPEEAVRGHPLLHLMDQVLGHLPREAPEAGAQVHHSPVSGDDQLHGSSEADMVRAVHADPPSVTPLDVARAMIDRSLKEIRQVFPKQAIFLDGDDISIITYEESLGIVAQDHVQVLVADESADLGEIRTPAGQQSIIVPEGSAPDEVTRLLARTLGDIYAARFPGSPDGAFKELDALSLEWNRAEFFAADFRQRGDETAARVWGDEAIRLRAEFRRQAEEIGIVPRDENSAEAASVRRGEAWPGMSDNTRRLATRLAEEPMPSFIPETDYFKDVYNRLDSLVHYLKAEATPAEREEFGSGLFREITSQDFPAAFKDIYKKYLPSISAEGELTVVRWSEALLRIYELNRQVAEAYARVIDWADQRGILERNGVTLDQATQAGEEEYRRAYTQASEKIQKILTEIERQYDVSLDYVGSMRAGARGPHKGGVHVNLEDFDLDLFMVDRDRYDSEYLRVLEHFPSEISRNKILYRDPSLSPPDLTEVNDAVVARLRAEFPDNKSVAESTIALRREPPPTPHHNPIADALAGPGEEPPLTPRHDTPWPPDVLALAAPPEHPEWQGNFHYKDGYLIIGDDAELARGTGQAPAGELIVKAHGRGGQLFLTKDSQEPLVMTDPAFVKMLTDAGLKPGMAIVLASCEAGIEGGAADQLAGLFRGTAVIAAEDAVWDDHQGGLFAAGQAVENGMPRPNLAADETGVIRPDGAWREHRYGARPVELTADDPRRPAEPAALDPAGNYARLASYDEMFGSRRPASPLAEIADASARHTQSPVVHTGSAQAGEWRLSPALDPAAAMLSPARLDTLNVALRDYAHQMLDQFRNAASFQHYLDLRKADVVALDATERIAKANGEISTINQQIAGLQAKHAQIQADLQTERAQVLSDITQTRADLAAAGQSRQLAKVLQDRLQDLNRHLRQVDNSIADAPGNARKELGYANRSLGKAQNDLTAARQDLQAATTAGGTATPRAVRNLLEETAAMNANPTAAPGTQRLDDSIVQKLTVHSIPAEIYWFGDGSLGPPRVAFYDGGVTTSYEHILHGLDDLRARYDTSRFTLPGAPSFDARYAQAVLDLADANPGGQGQIPATLTALAEAIYGPDPVRAFMKNPTWSGDDPIGTFFHDAAALTVLQLGMEGARNPSALVTNVMVWDMAAHGTFGLDRVLGYLNVMGPGRSVAAGLASDQFNAPGGPAPAPSVSQQVAEMEMRQRQIVALYAATIGTAAGYLTVPETPAGVTALSQYLNGAGGPGAALNQLMTKLRRNLGW